MPPPPSTQKAKVTSYNRTSYDLRRGIRDGTWGFTRRNIFPITRSANLVANKYHFHGHTLTTVNSAKCQWVTIKQDLTWDQRVTRILWQKHPNKLDQTKCLILKIFVLTLLQYACNVWDPNQLPHIHKLDAVQRCLLPSNTGTNWHDRQSAQTNSK